MLDAPSRDADSAPPFLGWTAENIEKLRTLILLDRKTAAQAARALGVTKNSVIGKCHREDIAFPGFVRIDPPERLARRREKKRLYEAMYRARKRENNPRRRPHDPVRAALAREKRALRELLPSQRLSPLNVFPERGGCLFGIGDPGAAGFRFCGRRAVRGSYCAPHAERCYYAAD